jgi:hypothetical protein
VPVASIAVSEASQRQFCAFLRGVAEAIRDHPGWLGLSDRPDDAYDHGELQNRRPALRSAMHSIKRKIDDFVTLLLEMGLAGVADEHSLRIQKDEVKLDARTQARLARFGLTLENTETETTVTCEMYPHMFQAWSWLATSAVRTRSAKGPAGTPPARFSHCLYSETYPYARDVLLRLAEDSRGLPALVDVLEREGYTLVCNRGNQINADWIKPYGRADDPLKIWWAERTHGGLAFDYDWLRRYPVQFGLRIPAFKTLLQHLDAMPDQVKAFVVQQTKHCNGLGSCTQTDKTGKLPRAFVPVEHNGTHALCTMFPGFQYAWQRLGDAEAADIGAFLAFTDETLRRL